MGTQGLQWCLLLEGNMKNNIQSLQKEKAIFAGSQMEKYEENIIIENLWSFKNIQCGVDSQDEEELLI